MPNNILERFSQILNDFISKSEITKKYVLSHYLPESSDISLKDAGKNMLRKAFMCFKAFAHLSAKELKVDDEAGYMDFLWSSEEPLTALFSGWPVMKVKKFLLAVAKETGNELPDFTKPWQEYDAVLNQPSQQPRVLVPSIDMSNEPDSDLHDYVVPRQQNEFAR